MLSSRLPSIRCRKKTAPFRTAREQSWPIGTAHVAVCGSSLRDPLRVIAAYRLLKPYYQNSSAGRWTADDDPEERRCCGSPGKRRETTRS